MNKLLDFVKVYRLYRHHHPARTAARTAYDIAIKGTPF